MSLRAGEPPEWVGTRVEVGHEVWRRADKGTAAVPVGTGVTGFRAVVVARVGLAAIPEAGWGRRPTFSDQTYFLAAVVVARATRAAAATAATAAAVVEPLAQLWEGTG